MGFNRDALCRREVTCDQALRDRTVVQTEATIRESKDRRLLFILNTMGELARIGNVPAGKNLLGDGKVRGGKLSLPAYGCSIIELD